MTARPITEPAPHRARRGLHTACVWTLATLLAVLGGCGSEDGSGAASGGLGGGGGWPTGGAGGTGNSGGWPSGGSAGSAAAAGAGATAGSGGSTALACDSRFRFSADPIQRIQSGVPFRVTFTDTPGHAYIGLNVSGPGAPVASDLQITGNGPFSWSWRIDGHAAGILSFTFTRDNGVPVASCEARAIDSGGSGGSGGSSGSGGSGATGGSAGSGGGPVGNCSDQPARNRFGMNSGDASAADLRAAGARWSRIEWRNWVDATAQRTQIASLRSGGIRVMLLVDYASPAVPSPGTPGDAAAWNAYLPQFISKVSELAASFGNDVDAWEIWNEPDLTAEPGYDPYVPPDVFGRMLKDASAAIRPHSQSPIVIGGLASGNTTYLQDAQNAAAGIFADAVGVHPYGQRAPDGWPDTTWGFGNLSDLFDNYLAFGKPLWVTEIGTVDTARQAEYLQNVYQVAAGYGSQVPIVFWFCWTDAMVSPFGLLDTAGNPKPAYGAYQSSAPAWDPSCEG